METIILRLLPPPLRRSATPERLAVLMEFFRFGLVGLTGFIVDTAIVYGTRAWLELYGAGVLSYLIAATVNWALNRVFMFRGRGKGPMHLQWAMFLMTNLVGFALNRGEGAPQTLAGEPSDVGLIHRSVSLIFELALHEPPDHRDVSNIGDDGQDSAAGAQRSMGTSQCRPRIVEVLQYIEKQDDVEVDEARQGALRFDGADANVMQPSCSFGGSVWIPLDPVHLASLISPQDLPESAGVATDIQHPCAPRDGAKDPTPAAAIALEVRQDEVISAAKWVLHEGGYCTPTPSQNGGLGRVATVISGRRATPSP